MKNKLKLITILFIVFSIFFTGVICYAAEDTIPTADDNTINTTQINDSQTKNSDLFAIQDSTTVDYNVDGNVYIIGKTVNIASQVSGDAFIIAETINVEGNIANNLFALGKTINVNGNVSTLYASGSNITIGQNGVVSKDAYIASDTFNILGTIQRDAFVGCDNISFVADQSSSHGTVSGNFNYYSKNEINLTDGYVGGSINFNQVAEKSNVKTFSSYLMDAATYITTAALVYLLIVWLAPKFKGVSEKLLTKKIGSVIGFGLLALFVTPIAILILMLLEFTIVIAFALLATYILTLLIASAVFIVGLAEIIASKLKTDNKWRLLGLVAGLTLVIWLIKLIPILGGLVSFVMLVLGLGILITNLVSKEKVETEQV